MGWRDHLDAGTESVVLPWTGGHTLFSASCVYRLDTTPSEFGWYRFAIRSGSRRSSVPGFRPTATDPQPVDPVPSMLRHVVAGYLVGDRLVVDDARIDPDPRRIVEHSERAHILPDGLDRFARVRAGRVSPDGPLVFLEPAFPLGPEEDVLNAFLEGRHHVEDIRGVTPALDAAFRMEIFWRDEADRRRREIERRVAEEQARLAQERRRRELVERLGDGAGRREMAREDFAEAAKAALVVGGAEYLDHRGIGHGEWAVKYRVDGQRLECVCDTNLQIVDAGICLHDHETDERGDTYFTLESLPAIVRQATREGKLVVWRHV